MAETHHKPVQEIPSTPNFTYFSHTNTVVNEIFKVVSAINCKESVKTTLCKSFLSLPKIILFLLISHYVSNTQDLLVLFKSLAWFLIRKTVYITETFNNTDANTLEWHVCTEIKKHPISGMVFPMVFQDNGIQLVVERARFFSTAFRDVLKNAKISFEKFKESKKQKKSNCMKISPSLTFKSHNPSNLFPASNFKKLSTIITNYLRVCEITQTFSVLGILLDGETGLGKTKFMDFLAVKNIVSNIYKIDMTTLLSTNLESILLTAYHKIDIYQSTVFVIDELDKYIDYNIQHSFVDYCKSLENTTRTSSTTQTENMTGATEKGSAVKVDFKTYEKQKRINYLYSLLGILERDGLSCSCIVIFCSNNFDTIFGNLDTTHFESLKNRFMKITFNRCDKPEFVRYLEYYYNLFVGTEFKWSKQDLDDAIANTRKDLSIPYRDLHHMTVMSEFKLPILVDSVNKWNSQPKTIENTCEQQFKNVDDCEEPPFFEEVPREKIITNEKFETRKGFCEKQLQNADDCEEPLQKKEVPREKIITNEKFETRKGFCDKLSYYLAIIHAGKSAGERISAFSEFLKFLTTKDSLEMLKESTLERRLIPVLGEKLTEFKSTNPEAIFVVKDYIEILESTFDLYASS